MINSVNEVTHKLEHYDTIIQHTQQEGKQSSITSREDSNKNMKSCETLAAEETSSTVSKAQRSSTNSEAVNSLHFDKLPAEVQCMIIEECIPERNYVRLFSVCLDANNQILLKEELDIKHTSLLFVSRSIRRIYLHHLPVVLPSLDKKIPVCIHQDTTVILKMEEPDYGNIRICDKGKIPACFSEIRYLAVPLNFFSFFNITADERSRGERIQELAVAHNISFLSRLIFVCSNLRSLAAVHHNTAEKRHLRGLNHSGTLVVPKVFSSLLRWNLESLSNFLNLQRAMTGYRSKELACRVMVFTLGSSVNKGLNISQNEIDTIAYLRVSKKNATKLACLDIESFVDKNFHSSPHSDEIPENLLSERGRTAFRAVFHRLVTRWMDKYFNSTNIENSKHGREILELMEDAFEQHKRSNPGEVSLFSH
ncbi:hypothetical protein BOTNAR_0002g00010 [Botryotinia narcissicola]|uniref:Uncharacterized protein n=1 Tax=Botryotinia narcissicola TaxID=278944 RepID=A0A4Z1JMS0_9HELO|nr:hypothetical protein BOTNAR_0002g00010 [Botryotinia narcissicola]